MNSKKNTYLDNFENDSPASIVAEISANHQGKIENAIKLIDIAKSSGANAVKFQTYTAGTISISSKEDDFLLPKNSPWEKFISYYDLYSESFTPWGWHKTLFDYVRKNKMIPFSSPFDETAVDFLETLDCNFYKLASPEINHIPLIRKIAKTKKPIIISLGTASELDLDLAISEFRKLSSSNIVIMQCESNYPASENTANLNLLNYLRNKYKIQIGYSDHTIGYKSATIAVALGAKVIEKHISEAGNTEDIDGFFSATETSFPEYCTEIRSTELILGHQEFRYKDRNPDVQSKQRSIYPINNVKKGEISMADDIKVVRPGHSLEPIHLDTIIGKRAVRDLRVGERIKLDDFE
jgi:pseudaminic acid synthase